MKKKIKMCKVRAGEIAHWLRTHTNFADAHMSGSPQLSVIAAPGDHMPSSGL